MPVFRIKLLGKHSVVNGIWETATVQCFRVEGKRTLMHVAGSSVYPAAQNLVALLLSHSKVVAVLPVVKVMENTGSFHS